MKIYTRTGDKGETGLFGGSRISKSDLRLHAYGTIDELNACIGLILSEKDMIEDLRKQLIDVQRTLFTVGADLATPLSSAASVHRLDAPYAKELERWIDAMDECLLPLTQFILPGGSRPASLLHLARTTCRRAERWIIALKEREEINPEIIIFVNRLSDYLFTAARYVNRALHIDDTLVRTLPERDTRS